MNVIKFNYGFKITVCALIVAWLSILASNLISPRIGRVSIVDAEENFVAQDFILSEEDFAKIADLKSTWSDEDVQSNSKLRAEKALEAYNRGDFENAVALYNESLAIGDFSNGNDVSILLNLALAYEAFGDSLNAIRTYRLIQSKVTPQNAVLNVAKGKIYLLGEFIDVKKSILAFKTALLLEPDNFEANNTLALIYMGEYGSEFTDFQKALEYNTKMRKIAPKNPNVRINLAINFIELGQLSYAQEHLEYVLSVQPESVPANYLMMKVSHLNRDGMTAKAYAEKLIGWYPDFTEDKLVAEVLGNK